MPPGPKSPEQEQVLNKNDLLLPGLNPWSIDLTNPGQVFPGILDRTLPSVVWVEYPSGDDGNRHQAPLAGGEVWGDGAWVVTDVDAAKAILNNSIFSSAGTEAEQSPGVVKVGSFPWQAPTTFIAGEMLVNQHGEEHQKLRKMLTKPESEGDEEKRSLLTPKGVAELMPSITTKAQRAYGRIAEQLKSGNSVNLHQEIGRITTGTICDLMGIPEEGVVDGNVERDELTKSLAQELGIDPGTTVRDWIADSIDLVVEDPDSNGGRAFDLLRLSGTVASHYIKMRDQGQKVGGIIGQIITPQGNEGQLDSDELDQFFSLMLIAGTETSRSAALIGIQQILDQSKQDESFREAVISATGPDGNPEELKELINQTLAYASPVRAVRRVATESVDVGGVSYEEGDTVIINFAQANNRRLLDAGIMTIDENGQTRIKFDLSKEVDPFVFGWGRHVCLGANLARAEISQIYQEILNKLLTDSPGATISSEPTDSTFISSPKSSVLSA